MGEIPLFAETRYGYVRAVVADSSRVFRSIRYAAAPVGPLRFAPPQAPEPWQRPPEWVPRACPQFGEEGLMGEEDRLMLDVRYASMVIA